MEHFFDQLTTFIRARRSDLVALARAEGVGPEDAVDCLQEGLCTLLNASRHGTLPETESDWSGVLAMMVRNAARNRRRRHFRAKPHEDLDEERLSEPGAPAADDLVARAEEHVRLHACIAELCEIQKAVVTLRLLEERPGEDVAQSLGISAGHVAVLLHRAKTSLRSCMARPE